MSRAYAALVAIVTIAVSVLSCAESSTGVRVKMAEALPAKIETEVGML